MRRPIPDDALRDAHKFRRRGLMAMVAAVVVYTADGLATVYGTPRDLVAWAKDWTSSESCESRTQVDTRHVEDVLRQPDTVKDIDDLRVKDNAYYSLLQRQAKRYGLTVVDPRPYVQAVEQTQDVESALQITRDFWANFGVDLRLHTHFGQLPLLGLPTPLDPSDISLEDFRYGAKEQFQYYATVPTELIRAMTTGPTYITGPADNFLGWAHPTTGETLISINAFYGENAGSTSMHEWGHHAHFKLAGERCARQDPTFDALNNGEKRWTATPDMGSDPRFADRHGADGPMEDVASTWERSIGGNQQLPLEVSAQRVSKRSQWFSRTAIGWHPALRASCAPSRNWTGRSAA